MSHACRFCGAPLAQTFCDLGMSPLSNAYVAADQGDAPETFYPLHARVCAACKLVQLPAMATPEAIFGEYAYFSSCSESWLRHAERFAAAAAARLALGGASRVVEIASNDGYLLQYFRRLGTRTLGIEPARNVARVAREKGIETVDRFFGTALAEELRAEGIQADLLIGNNVLAHVPDLNDFVAGMQRLLAPEGVISMEFPHLLRLIEACQFDTIYHEHFSYFSLLTVEQVFRAHGLEIFDVEELPTHGGSLRILARHAGAGPAGDTGLSKVRADEREARLDRIETYAGFAARVQEVKRTLLEFLIAARRQGRRIVGYGAPAKATTLLNYCGVRGDFIDYVVDRNAYKQGRFMPGTRIPIRSPEQVAQDRPDYLLILPWNLRQEIIGQMAHIRDWGGRFVVPVPQPQVLP